MKKYFLLLVAATVARFTPVYAAPLKIAAALPDLGSIAAYIGGDKVEVFAIGRNNSNPHVVEVLPSYMIKVSRAQMYLKVGLALDVWSDEIIDGSRNEKLIVVDCSEGIAVLEKPVGRVSALMGDVHPEGNPHYWLDPANGIIIAKNILAGLEKVDPENSTYYEKNYENFKSETERRLAVWKAKMAGFSGAKIIGYHSSWVYFAAAFGMTIAANVEPVPGIPPTGKHLAKLVDIIRNENISILLQEPYFPDDAPKFLMRETGIRVIKAAPSCADVRPDSYFNHFDELVGKITQGR